MGDVTVFVSSWDKYAATWGPFCHGFGKYWPDCPWPLVFMTNSLEPPCGESIKTGADTNWTAMMQIALPQVETPVILLLMDDYWFLAPPDTATLLEYAAYAVRGEADAVGLWLCGSEVFGTEDFGLDSRLFVFRQDAQYRASLRAAFWRVDALLGLLSPGEDLWEFECRGSGRSRESARIVCVKELGCILYPSPVTPGWPETPVLRGQWRETAYRYAEREGLDVDFSKHPNWL
jgi:hypothetical protein